MTLKTKHNNHHVETCIHLDDHLKMQSTLTNIKKILDAPREGGVDYCVGSRMSRQVDDDDK